MGTSRRWPFGVAAIGAHAALVALIPAFEGPDPSDALADTIVSEMEIVGPPPVAPRVDDLQIDSDAPPIGAIVRTRAPRTVGTLESTAQPSSEAPTESIEIAPAEIEAEIEAVREPRPIEERAPIDLSPDAVARAYLPLEGEPSMPRALVPEARVGIDEQALEATVSADLRGLAMAQAYLSSHEIELHARPDGSYVHRGDAFVATIHPDGTVDFEDRAGATVDGPVATTVDGRIRAADGSTVLPELLTAPQGLMASADRQSVMIGVGGTFDVQGEMMRAGGHDPSQAERLRFLEETEALRDELTDRHAAQLRARALRGIPGRLSRIWRDETRAAEQRRAALFEVWDACTDDDDGNAARERIERWVRAHLASGTPDAFTPEELRALNARRESSGAFAPYR